MSFRFYKPESLPEPYDVIWCRFPLETGPEFHPCLVLESLVDSEGRPHVRMICGTSNPARTGREYFPVEAGAALKCGLGKKTMFNLESVRRIPWAEEFFEWVGGGPKPRRLPAECEREFQVHAAHYQHETGWSPFET